jgi:NADH-dependent peroxiredoxin subunit F
MNPESNLYDLAIIGGGPAGVAAGVYASRKHLRTVLITGSFGGQSVVSTDIQNWLGSPSISGEKLAENMKNHLLAYAGDIIDVREGEHVQSVKKALEGFTITTEAKSYTAKTVLIATGSNRRKLDIPGAEQYENKGITYCASCDGPLFTDKDVVVIGGGNAAFESAAQLLAYCKSVTILNRSDKFRADPVTIHKLQQNPKLKVVTNAVPVEIKGTQFVSSIVYENKDSKKKTELPAEGIFVEIGHMPATEFARDLIKCDEFGHVIIDPRTQRASLPGIWAAGDCTDGLYHQNNIAAGEGVKALEDIYLHIHTK